jgi:subtilisin family serine protease
MYYRLAEALLALGLLTSHVLADDDGPWESDQLVCSLNPGGVIDSINARYGTITMNVIYAGATSSYLIGTAAGEVEDSLADLILLDPDVLYCAPNFYLDAPEPVQRSQPFLDVVGEAEVQAQPAATHLQLAVAQTQSTGLGVKVAVIDGGVDASQPMLAGSVLAGFDFVDNDTDAHDESGGPASGHGTFVAGVVNLVAPDAWIVPYRVIDTLGRGNGYQMARAVIDAVSQGCKVINISMVMQGKHPTLDVAIEYAKNQHVLVVAAAGNDSADAQRFPASDSYTLGVAALDSADLKADFSNFGSFIDVCAPGTSIKGPFLDTVFARWDGTSFAAPFVAGTGALLYALRPGATWDDVVTAIEETAIDLDSLNPGFAGQLGRGRIEPQAAVNAWWPMAGDLNESGYISSADIIFLVNFVFKSGPAPDELDTADVDASCDVTSADVIYLVNYNFKVGPAPQPGCVP